MRTESVEENTMQESGTVGQVPAFEKFIDLAAAAALLELHPDTVKKKTRTGEIPGRKIGRRWRYRLSELDAWAKSTLISRQPNHIA